MDTTPWCSRVVPYHSTNQAQWSLSSWFWWSTDYSSWYGRIRKTLVSRPYLYLFWSTRLVLQIIYDFSKVTLHGKGEKGVRGGHYEVKGGRKKKLWGARFWSPGPSDTPIPLESSWNSQTHTGEQKKTKRKEEEMTSSQVSLSKTTKRTIEPHKRMNTLCKGVT